MQIGAEINSYKREGVGQEKAEEKKSGLVYKSLFIIILGAFVSRAMLINDTAPFGIAMALTMVRFRSKRRTFALALGPAIGYLTMISSLRDWAVYMICLGTITLINYIAADKEARTKLIIMFSAMFLEVLVYKAIVYKYVIGVNVLMSAFEVGCIFPIYYIMNYAAVAGRNLRTKHLFKNEEIISLAVIGCLAISGAWGITVFGVNVRNILGLSFIVLISYINGSAIGAAAGVAMGIIIGMSSANMMDFISIYGVCGLIIGVFKETGKWFTALAYIVTFSILKFYSGLTSDIKVLEGIITMGAFIVIPESVYDRWSLEFDWERKQEVVGEDYIDKIKDVFSKKLSSFSNILNYISSTLNDLADNDKIYMKKKSSGLVDNLADVVCGSCDMKAACWRREFHQTCAAFEELIQNYPENKDYMPAELDRKCIKRTALSRAAGDIMNNYIIGEMCRQKITEGREILSGQIRSMAETMDDMAGDFAKEVKFDIELEMILRKALNSKQIFVKDILCYEDRYDRIHITIKGDHCSGNQMCIKKILPIINEVTEKTICTGDDGCNIDGKTGLCTMTFEETPKYHIAAYVEQANKDGETFNGDSYSCQKLLDGTHLSVISDGMGCGYDAYKESKASVELIEKFSECGFGREATINTVNSIMGIRFSDQEKYSTLDLTSVDLYSGEATFIKVGGVDSFIKNGKDVDTIRCRTLPIGVLDKADADVIDRKVENGSIIINLSDGVLDAGKKDWMCSYLKNTDCSNPKELASDIIKKAKEINGGKVNDDMTVIVSKVYSLY